MSASVVRATSASPWDAIAGQYDQVFTESRIGKAQRAAVQRVAAQTFRAGDHVLELNCGTGVDAIFLAQRGIRVSAFDQSAAMIHVARDRARTNGVERLVTASVLDTEEIDSLRGYYDGAFSNFSGLNCVRDLAQVARDLSRLLRPCAPALLCFSTRFCAWEVLWFACRGNLRKATRRMRSACVTAEVAPGAAVHVAYPTVRTIRQQFAPYFRLVDIRGIGVAVPPSYAEEFACRHPAFLRTAQYFDDTFSSLPGLRAIGDHVLLRFERCA